MNNRTDSSTKTATGSEYENFLDDPMLDESTPDPSAELPEDEQENENPRPRSTSGFTPQQQQYAKEAKLRAEVEQKCNEVVRETFNKLAKENPSLAMFGFIAQNRLYQKRPPGFSKIVPAIADRLSWQGQAHRTQADILADIQAAFPGYPNISANIWARELQSHVLKKIRQQFQSSFYHSVDLKDCKSLAQIKKAVLAADKTANAKHSFRVTVAIATDALVVNDVTYPIINHTSGRYAYPSVRVTVDGKRPWVQVAHLIALLKGE
jgi:hypothetical protein